MTPLPPPSPSTTSHYNELISILTPTATNTTPLEIDILPSSFPPIIHYTSSPPSLGIPKALLTPLFLIAHGNFFSYVKSYGSLQRSHNERGGGYKAALDATAVLLLWDPNYITAVNFRRWYIASVYDDISRSSDRNDEQDGEKGAAAAAAISQELHLLENLLTSPLPKHAKSSTLWSYRLWLLSRLHPPLHLKTLLREDGETQGQTALTASSRYKSELGIIMRAAERHPRNYYAWGYARDLLRLLGRDHSSNGNEDGKRTVEMTTSTRKELARASIKDVHHWCMQHPRDISGWSYLIFLMSEILPEGDGGGGEKINACSDGHMSVPNDDDGHDGNDDANVSEVQNIITSTQDFTKKYTWKGESIEWFLNAARDVLPD